MSAVDLPNIREPFLDARSGQISRAWWIWLQQLMTRIGGSDQIDVSKIIALIEEAFAQIQDQSVPSQDMQAFEALRRLDELERIVPSSTLLKGLQDRLDELEAQLGGALQPIVPQATVPVPPAFTAPTLLNSWVDFGAPFNPTGHYKDAFGVVHLRGTVKSGIIGNPIFQLPAGSRPTNSEIFPTISNGAIGRVVITSGGDVTADIGSNVYVALDGMTFRAA